MCLNTVPTSSSKPANVSAHLSHHREVSLRKNPGTRVMAAWKKESTSDLTTLTHAHTCAHHTDTHTRHTLTLTHTLTAPELGHGLRPAFPALVCRCHENRGWCGGSGLGQGKEDVDPRLASTPSFQQASPTTNPATIPGGSSFARGRDDIIEEGKTETAPAVQTQQLHTKGHMAVPITNVARSPDVVPPQAGGRPHSQCSLP